MFYAIEKVGPAYVIAKVTKTTITPITGRFWSEKAAFAWAGENNVIVSVCGDCWQLWQYSKGVEE